MVGNAVLDVIAGLNGIGQLLIVGAGILHSLQLGTVQADPLGNLIDGLTPVFAGQVDIDIDAFTGIDEARHPASPNGIGISVCLDEQETVVSAVHNDEIMMSQIQASRGNEMGSRNMRNRIYADHAVFGCHGIYNDTVCPVRKGFVYAGSAVEEHVKDLSGCQIRILGLQDIVAALQEISPGILLCGHQHGVDLGIVVRLISADGLILVNQKEAPGKRFSGTDILDQPDVILAEVFTLLIIFRSHFLTQHRDMLIGIRFTGNGLKLKFHGRDLQPAGKGRKNVELLLRRSEHEIDRFDLKDLNVPAIRGFHDAVTDLLDREERLDKLKLFGLYSFCLCAPVF